MSEGLEAIATELRRLQREGVNQVFVEDSTMRLLTPQAGRSESTAEPQALPADHSNLEALIQDRSNDAPKPKNDPPPSAKRAPLPETAPTVELPKSSPEEQMESLRAQVLACPVCNEHLSEKGKVVFGVGSPTAEIFFCGEAPGADEELAGEPFVGKAGQLLTKIIHAMGLSRETVYIANILKWRPEHDKPYGNRPPTIEEMNYCLPYLKAQIQIIRPKVIVALGNTAVTGLLGPDPSRKMGQVRGTWDRFADIPVMITFHPSYLLRNGTMKTKRMVWEDMLEVMQKCGLEISEKQRGFFLPKT